MNLKSSFKLISINLLILSIIYTIPILIFIAPNEIRKKYGSASNDQRAYYPVYKDQKKSEQIFKEYGSIQPTYLSYLMWRRKPQKDTYVNILNPYRTRLSRNEQLEQSTWFFGGSTIWGVGVSDYETIPSHYSLQAKEKVMNFGEVGWNSRQSLNQLQNLVGDKKKAKTIIFYDGINDSVNQCRTEAKVLAYNQREGNIKSKISTSLYKQVVNSFISPYKYILWKFGFGKSSNPKYYDCSSNKDKARKVATHMINDWKTAALISNNEGIKFYAILQPTIYTSISDTNHLKEFQEIPINKSQILQTRAVYEQVKILIKDDCENEKLLCKSFIDGTKWLKTNKPIFIDLFHVDSHANKMIAENLNKIINTK